jgi:hypothetical protein
MSEGSAYFSPEYGLEDWEEALTIEVGTAYACRGCQNLVMVTKGGIGVMELTCCGRPMEVVEPSAEEGE